jgi:hypothetical protein
LSNSNDELDDPDHNNNYSSVNLIRPISKKDLFEAFNSYRVLVGEDEEKTNHLSRLYNPSKARLNINSIPQRLISSAISRNASY